jgi:hypothetical protein
LLTAYSHYTESIVQNFTPKSINKYSESNERTIKRQRKIMLSAIFMLPFTFEQILDPIGIINKKIPSTLNLCLFITLIFFVFIILFPRDIMEITKKRNKSAVIKDK